MTVEQKQLFKMHRNYLTQIDYTIKGNGEMMKKDTSLYSVDDCMYVLNETMIIIDDARIEQLYSYYFFHCFDGRDR